MTADEVLFQVVAWAMVVYCFVVIPSQGYSPQNDNVSPKIMGGMCALSLILFYLGCVPVKVLQQ